MKILVSGASGFIGTNLIQKFREKGWQAGPLGRAAYNLADKEFAEALSGCEVIINLTGAPVLKRWTARYKQQLYDSRILTTRKLVHAVLSLEQRPFLFLNTSASGIYEDPGVFSEKDLRFSDSFLGLLCRKWEDEVQPLEGIVPSVICRLGVVLGKGGGALPPLLRLFRSGLGGRIASGKQGFSWIHLEDLLNAYVWIISNIDARGIYHLVSPHPVDNQEFTRTLARTLHRPAVMPVPGFALRILYGEGASFLTTGQKLVPERLSESGFAFKFPFLEEALKNLVQG